MKKLTLEEIFDHIEYRVYYIRWCIRFPKLFLHRCYIGAGSHLYVDANSRLHFSPHVYFSRHFTGRFYGNVTIGDHVFFQHHCHISVHEELTIGDNSTFGEGVSIHDETHIISTGSDPIDDRGLVTKPITIGRNVWVGAKATILTGVHIGDNAVMQ